MEENPNLSGLHKSITAKYNNKPVVITYVTADLAWTLVSYDLQNQTKRFKVDVIELEGVSNEMLYELYAYINEPIYGGR